MTGELSLYQYKDHDLVQLTDGRPPESLDEYREGWRFHQKIPATTDAVSKISAKSASAVLNEVQLQGYSQLNRFEIQGGWRKHWTAEGRRDQ